MHFGANVSLMQTRSTLVALALLVPSIANAHIALTYPAPRYSSLKQGPCGKGAMDARTTTVTTFEPGAKIIVKWIETIGHPGHYRIAFDPNGTSIFKDPTSFTDVSGGPGVLIDGIPDKTGTQSYTQEITLPNVECTNCTLQVIQVMTDKAPYGDGNDNYYQCADLVLKRADGGAPVADAGTSSSSSSSSGGASSSSSSSGSSEPDDDAGAGATSSGANAEGAEEGSGCSVRSNNLGNGTLVSAALALAVGLVLRRRPRK
jgi:hypothetical protein